MTQIDELLIELDIIWKKILFNPNIVILKSRKNTIAHALSNAFTLYGLPKTESQIFSLIKGKRNTDISVICSLLDLDIIVFNSNYTFTKYIQSSPKHRYLMMIDDTNRLLGYYKNGNVSFILDNNNIPEDINIIFDYSLLVSKHIDNIIENAKEQNEDITIHDIVNKLYDNLHTSDITNEIINTIVSKLFSSRIR